MQPLTGKGRHHRPENGGTQGKLMVETEQGLGGLKIVPSGEAWSQTDLRKEGLCPVGDGAGDVAETLLWV